MSTPVRRRDGDGAVTTPWREHVRCLVDGARTHGAYSVGEISTSSGWRRGTYVHHLADETFYVAVGDVHVVVDGGEPVLLPAGAALHVPRGAPRSLVRTGDGDGRLLLVQTPGGLLELPATAGTAAASGLELVDPA